MVGENILYHILQDSKTVYRINDIAMLANVEKDSRLAKKLHYYVKTGRLRNPRRGIYTKIKYNSEELACLLFTPNYISLEYVLQRAGIIFQFDSAITNSSYLSREIIINKQLYKYRQFKGEILVNLSGINRKANGINIATPERAALDMLYLNKAFYFDNINPINKEKIAQLLSVYNSPALNKQAKSTFKL